MSHRRRSRHSQRRQFKVIDYGLAKWDEYYAAAHGHLARRGIGHVGDTTPPIPEQVCSAAATPSRLLPIARGSNA